MRRMTRRELLKLSALGLGSLAFRAGQLAGNRSDFSEAPAFLPGCSASWAGDAAGDCLAQFAPATATAIKT
jgi:hypothetical protein